MTHLEQPVSDLPDASARPFSELTADFSPERKERIAKIRQRIEGKPASEVLNIIADEVESRGCKQLDLDPGETADWLRSEASESLNADCVDRSGSES